MSKTISIHLPILVKLKTELIFKILLTINFSLLIFYIFQIGNIIKLNYLINSSENELNQILAENLILDTTLRNFASLERVEKEIKNFDFVKVSKIKYIPISSEYLVRNNH